MRRRDECLTIRADVIDRFPDGVPAFLVGRPEDEVCRFMYLRERGYTLLGLDPSDDISDLVDD